MSDVLALLLRLNLAIGAAVALALVLRLPVRRLFGARVAYGVWVLVPLAAAAMLAPARAVTIVRAIVVAPAQAAGPAPQAAYVLETYAGPGPWSLVAVLWAAGGLASLAWLAWRQAQFGRALRDGRAGPAVIGVLRPRIVTPDDFDQRYTTREQRVVLAHEETHITRHDSRANAAVALLRCVNWFNPLVHLLAHYLRIDQELACDAQVVAAHPTARRAYAEAMLKTQLAARPLPLGCYWPAQAVHPLAQRIDLLSRRAPRPAVRAAGSAAIATLALSCAFASWAARPADLVVRAVPVTLPASGGSGPAFQTVSGPAPVAAQTPPAQATASAKPTAEPSPQTVADPPAPPPATAEPAAPSIWGKLIPAGDFGAPASPRRIHAVAQWSSVEPGSAVRVVATMTDPTGAPLTTDLTAFGSQSRYRLGYISRTASRYKLFTSVEQHGDKLTVTAGLNERFTPWATGSTTLSSGETGSIVLPNGLVVTVTPTVRPETPQEIAEARSGPPKIRVDRFDKPERPVKPVRARDWL